MRVCVFMRMKMKKEKPSFLIKMTFIENKRIQMENHRLDEYRNKFPFVMP